MFFSLAIFSLYSEIVDTEVSVNNSPCATSWIVGESA